MAAAQAAAEAVLRADAGEQQKQQQPSEEPSEATLAALLQQGFMGQEGQSLSPDAMALANEGNMQSLLQIMTQEEQQRQQMAALAAIAARPKEHFISIAQNGELQTNHLELVMVRDGTLLTHLSSFFFFRFDSRGDRNSNGYPAGCTLDDFNVRTMHPTNCLNVLDTILTYCLQF